jgi:uncharacterized protein
VNRRLFLRRAALSALAAPVVGLTYSRLEAHALRVVRDTVAIPHLPPAFVGKTVALLTDPHHGPFTSLGLIRKAVDLLNSLSPDLIALGGDFVQGKQARPFIQPCFGALAELRAPLGVFAVPGNHDHWDGIRFIRSAMRDHGIIDLTNTGRWIEAGADRLRIAGVDDLWAGRPQLDPALGDMSTQDASILLCHNPDYVETLTDERVGLVLSGHTHGGQIMIPGVTSRFIPSKYGMKYAAGLVQGPVAQVYVSRGVGTMGIPLRLACPPEVNLLTLVSAAEGRTERIMSSSES